MPRIRPDIAAIRPYVPGRHIDEVARDIGMRPDEIVKLASNESPEGPFPGVAKAVAAVLTESNRYPDTDFYELRRVVSGAIEVPPDHLWFGNGSVSLLSHLALTIGGPGTSAVYAWPSFVMYRVISRWAMSEPIEVPLGDGFVHDLDALRAAIRDDTSVVYLANPNNPTGTLVAADAIDEFIDSVPEEVLIVVDEAYHHFVDDESYATAIPQALARPNVVVLRTFSKIYALAAYRVGFGIAQPGTISELMKSQAPFSVSQVAQVAAAASLGNPEELARRVEANAAGRRRLLDSLVERDIRHAESQTNFVYCKLGPDSAAAAAAFTKRGVIIRPMSGGWVRVTIGTQAENQRFVAVLDELLLNLQR